MTLAGVVSHESRTGKSEIVLATDAHRAQIIVGPLYSADGVDASGAWTLDGGSGVVQRIADDEAIAPRFAAWVLRRSYLRSFIGARDRITCEDIGSGPGAGARVDVAFAIPELGAPVLAFDLESGALLASSHVASDGRPTRETYEAWSEPDHGVRWPRRYTEHPLVAGPTTHELAPPQHGTECMRFDPTGVAIPQRGAVCTAPPPDRFAMTWPSRDPVRVRLAMIYVGGVVMVRAKVEGRETIALLDSGATTTMVDATTETGKRFRSALEVSGTGATQKVRFGYGELAAIELGELRAERVPTLSVPIPSFDTFGDKRPELILGHPFFASIVVRVDYKHSEVVLAKSLDGLLAKGGEPRAIPLRMLKGKIVAAGKVEGADAAFLIDTGSDGGLDVFKSWASSHGLPGNRAVVDVDGSVGLGTGSASTQFFRLTRASLGPLAWDNQGTHMLDSPGAGTFAGLAGNRILARCDAVVFDVAKRKLWLEGACDRAVPERRMGWHFDKKVDAAYADRPWVVDGLWPGGAAEKAGVRVGDRVLEVGGKAATLDVGTLWAIEEQPEGTRVPVLLLRAGTTKARERVVAELRSPPL